MQARPIIIRHDQSSSGMTNRQRRGLEGYLLALQGLVSSVPSLAPRSHTSLLSALWCRGTQLCSRSGMSEPSWVMNMQDTNSYRTAWCPIMGQVPNPITAHGA